MAWAIRNSSKRSRLPINKMPIAQHYGWRYYTVDASAVRNVAQPDEEFANFATCEEFANLIPEHEIWFNESTFDREGVFFLANAHLRLKEKKDGASYEDAYSAGLEMERPLRQKITGLKFRNGKPHRQVPDNVYVEPYFTLDDAEFPIQVWLVDGCAVRSLYKTDYVEGGHGFVYPWVPKQQIWIEKDLDHWELPFITCHEYLELRLMRDHGMEYDPAHEVCSHMEFDLRKVRGAISLLTAGRRHLTKDGLHNLTGDEVFRYVADHYVKQ